MSDMHANALQDQSVASGAACADAVKHAIEARLLELLPNRCDPADVLTAAMRSAVLGAGKRMRPLLFMSIVRDLGRDATGLMDLACSIEIVHAASLVLDDLPCMDDATLRRGQPTIHRQFGEDVAMLAAVALLSHAFGIVACMRGVSTAARTRLTSVLAEAVGAHGLAKGQFLDLHGTCEQSTADIATTYALKTGALLGVVIDMAVIVAPPGAAATRYLQQFASAVGLAFQIRDDLFDAGAGPAFALDDLMGKDTGQDAGKATLPGALGIEAARNRMESEVRRAGQCLQGALGPDNRTRLLLSALFPDCGLPGTPLVMRAR